jgi:hypothetical protein
MSFGFIEILSVLMALSGTTIEANPKAPSGDVVLKYAPETSDLVLHVDAAAIVPDLYLTLSNLPQAPSVKDDPKLRSAVSEMLKEVEAGRGMVKAFTGIDVTTDVTSLTAWLTFGASGPPEAIIVVRGNFANLLLDRAATMVGGTVEEIDGQKTVTLPAQGMRVALTKDGDLLAGTDALIKARLGKDWKPAKRAKGSNLARIATMLDAKPFFLGTSTPSATAVTRATSELGANFGADLVGSHAFAALALHSTGAGWSWVGTGKASYERALLFSEGAIDLMRAGVVAPRGLVRVAVAALESYAGKGPEIDYLVKHKDELLKLVGDMTGDGNFAVKWDKDAKKHTLSVRATGKHFSEVVPVAAVAGMAATGFMVGSDMSKSSSKKSSGSSKPKMVQPPKPAATKKKPATPAKPAAKPSARP